MSVSVMQNDIPYYIATLESFWAHPYCIQLQVRSARHLHNFRRHHLHQRLDVPSNMGVRTVSLPKNKDPFCWFSFFMSRCLRPDDQWGHDSLIFCKILSSNEWSMRSASRPPDCCGDSLPFLPFQPTCHFESLTGDDESQGNGMGLLQPRVAPSIWILGNAGSWLSRQELHH